MRIVSVFLLSAALLLVSCWDNGVTTIQNHPAPQEPVSQPSWFVFCMKGVGIDLPLSDFTDLKNSGIQILATEWGMEQDVFKARVFLDKAQAAGMKVVMDGGFSYTAWGFSGEDWDRLPRGKLPAWQKQRVQDWINALKDHPAIYAWDISNEFGENLPDGANIPGSGWPKGLITTEQLKQARADVLAIDPSRPIQARMYGWDIGKMPAHVEALFENRIAEIISLNLYSNHLYRGKLEWPTVIEDAGARYVAEIKQAAPGTVVWISIAAFDYPAQFQRPSPANLKRDLLYAGRISGLDGLSFFCWGPVAQWDERGDWYLPQTGSDLWEVIKQYIAEKNALPAR